VLVRAIMRFLALHAPHLDTSPGARWLEGVEVSRARAAQLLGALPVRAADLSHRLSREARLLGNEACRRGRRAPHVSVDVGCTRSPPSSLSRKATLCSVTA